MPNHPVRTVLAFQIAAVVDVEAVSQEDAVAKVRAGDAAVATKMRPELGKLLTVERIGAVLRGEHADKPLAASSSCALHGLYQGDACPGCAAAPSEVLNRVHVANL